MNRSANILFLFLISVTVKAQLEGGKFNQDLLRGNYYQEFILELQRPVPFVNPFEPSESEPFHLNEVADNGYSKIIILAEEDTMKQIEVTENGLLKKISSDRLYECSEVKYEKDFKPIHVNRSTGSTYFFYDNSRNIVEYKSNYRTTTIKYEDGKPTYLRTHVYNVLYDSILTDYDESGRLWKLIRCSYSPTDKYDKVSYETYAYDTLDRITKMTLTSNKDQPIITEYIYSGNTIVGRIRKNGKIIRTNTWTLDKDSNIISFEFDARKSIRHNRPKESPNSLWGLGCGTRIKLTRWGKTDFTYENGQLVKIDRQWLKQKNRMKNTESYIIKRNDVGLPIEVNHVIHKDWTETTHIIYEK